MPEEDVPDDEEGRFFGGGIDNDTAEVLDFIDRREGEDAGVSSKHTVSRRALLTVPDCYTARDDRCFLVTKDSLEL